MMDRFSRRRFFSAFPLSLMSVREMVNSAFAFVKESSLTLLMQIRSGLGMYVRYRIETDRGRIEIQTAMDLTMSSGDSVNIKEKNLIRLELPSEILLALENGISKRAHAVGNILALSHVDLTLQNASIVNDGVVDNFQIKAANAASPLILGMDPSEWIPTGDEDPISLDFEEGQDLVVSIGPAIATISPPVTVKWPPFKVELGGEAIVGPWRFVRDDFDGLIAGLSSPKISGKHSFKVFAGKDQKDGVLILNEGSDTFLAVGVAWTPRLGQVRFSGAGTSLRVDPIKTLLACNLDIVQADTSLVIVAGERIPDAPVTGAIPYAPAPEFVPGTSIVQVWLSNFSDSSVPLWNFLPSDMSVQIGPYKGALQTRPREPKTPQDEILVKNGQLQSVVFTRQNGKKTTWRVDQFCKNLGLRFAGLAAGGLGDTVLALAQGPNLGCSPENENGTVEPVLARLNSDATGQIQAPSGKCISGKYIIVSADQLLSLDKTACFNMDSRAGTVKLRSADPAINWAGSIPSSKSVREAWAVMQKINEKPKPTDEHRPGELRVPGAVLEWSYKSGSSTLVTVVAPRSFASAVQLAALDGERFRAAVEPNSPTTLYESCLVAPFSLREHPTEFLIPSTCQPDKNVTDPGAFLATVMWEPQSKVAISPTEAVGSALEQLEQDSFGGGIEFRNAGLAMTGKVMDLKAAAWAPDSGLPKLAPYKALAVGNIVNTPSEDLFTPCTQEAQPKANGWRADFEGGLGVAGSETSQVQAAIASAGVPIALSPIGGSITFDWTATNPKILKGLSLHSFLGRYERNSATLVKEVTPWGLEIEIVVRLFRDISGEIKYRHKWRFVQPEQSYGTTNPVRIYNLRPLNATTWQDGQPLLFKADLDITSGKQLVTKKDVNLQGSVAPSDASTQNVQATVSFDDLPEADSTPRNVFDDTTILLHTITWQSAATNQHVDITVTAHGDIVQPGNLTLDSRAVSVSVHGKVDEFHHWAADQFVDPPAFQATRATLGPGMLRILPKGSNGQEPQDNTSLFPPKTAFSSNKTETSADVTAEYELNRDLDLRDVGFMQLLYPKVSNAGSTATKGKLTIHFSFHYHKENGQVTLDSQQSTAICKFPNLSGLSEEICGSSGGSLVPTLGIHPKSFEATLTETSQHATQSSHYTAQLIADVGVPGWLAFRDSSFQLQDGATTFHLGKFELCPSILTKILGDLFGKLNLFGSGSLSLHVGFDLHGPEIGLSINLLPANMGGGVISNLKFEIRLGIHIDSSTKGSGCAFALFFNLGEYLHPDLSLLDWSNPDISLSEFAQLMLRELRPVTLNIDPFVFRFTFILGVRRIDVSGIPEFGICLTADAGLGVSFDVGVANGGASVTVGARFCPDVRTGFIVSVGVMVDAWATVLSVINIRLHAELFVSLYLGCAPSFKMIGHLVFSGYASLTIAFVTISASFTVNLDNFLGLHPCSENPTTLASRRRIDDPALLSNHVRKQVREFAHGIRGLAA